MKKRVFVSFDYDNDQQVKVLLAGQAKYADSPFDFKDNSVKDHLPGDWKAKVAARMSNVDIVIFLCGRNTHKAAGVAAELEITRAQGKPYFFLAAYNDGSCTKPSNAYASEPIYEWTWDNLKKLIGGAR